MKYRIVKVESGMYRIQHLPDSYWRFVEYEDFHGEYETLEEAKEALQYCYECAEFDRKRNAVVEIFDTVGASWLDEPVMDDPNLFLHDLINNYLLAHGRLALKFGVYLYTKDSLLDTYDDAYIQWPEIEKMDYEYCAVFVGQKDIIHCFDSVAEALGFVFYDAD